MSFKNHCSFWYLFLVLQDKRSSSTNMQKLLEPTSQSISWHLFGVQVLRVTCQREARGARRKALMVMAGHRRRSSGHRQLLAPLSVDPTHQWPGCAQVLTCKLDSRVSSSTLNACPGLLETDPAWTPDSSLGTAVPLPPETATPLRPTMPTTGWPFHKVLLILQQLSSPLCSKGGGITLPPWRRPKLRSMARSGRTGRGSGGKSGSCCPQKTLTRCPKLWCDPRTRNLCFDRPLTSPASEQHGVVVYVRSCCFLQTFHPRTTNSHFIMDVKPLLVCPKKKNTSNISEHLRNAPPELV